MRHSESVNRRTGNTMAKQDKSTNNDLQISNAQYVLLKNYLNMIPYMEFFSHSKQMMVKYISGIRFCIRWVVYLILSNICTFTFEFKENSLSDTRCCTTSLYRDKRMPRRCTRSSLPNYFAMTSYL